MCSQGDSVNSKRRGRMGKRIGGSLDTSRTSNRGGRIFKNISRENVSVVVFSLEGKSMRGRMENVGGVYRRVKRGVS